MFSDGVTDLDDQNADAADGSDCEQSENDGDGDSGDDDQEGEGGRSFMDAGDDDEEGAFAETDSELELDEQDVEGDSEELEDGLCFLVSCFQFCRRCGRHRRRSRRAIRYGKQIGPRGFSW